MTDPTFRRPGIPSGPVVVFDGECNLCNAWVSFLIARDRRRIFRFATLQGRAGQRLLADAALPAEAGESVVLVLNGHAYAKSSAALRILQILGFPWALAGLLRLIPRPIRNAVYDFVARNRYRWFGKAATCRVPTQAERSLFLD